MEQDPFKTLFYDNAVNAVIAALYVEVPVLGVPPLSTIIDWAVHLFANALYSVLSKAITWEARILKDAHARTEYEKASIRLMEAEKAHGADSPEYKQAAKDEQVAYASFVHFNI